MKQHLTKEFNTILRETFTNFVSNNIDDIKLIFTSSNRKKLSRNIYVNCFNTLIQSISNTDFRLETGEFFKLHNDAKPFHYVNNLEYKQARIGGGKYNYCEGSTHAIEFINLYPNIQNRLIENNIIDFNRQSIKAVVKWISSDAILFRKSIKENDRLLANFIKFVINYTYGVLGSSKFNINCCNYECISKYIHPFYELMIILAKNSIVKIDVDIIYVKDYNPESECYNSINHVLGLINIPYNIIEI